MTGDQLPGSGGEEGRTVEAGNATGTLEKRGTEGNPRKIVVMSKEVQSTQNGWVK